jgi:hypothetical protein
MNLKDGISFAINLISYKSAVCLKVVGEAGTDPPKHRVLQVSLKDG